ncbi:MAG: flagellar export protein FliJ [Ignavibacteriales bacterium]|nr:flagellar export protein FliJ [Ignavibacteriales bacterium]
MKSQHSPLTTVIKVKKFQEKKAQRELYQLVNYKNEEAAALSTLQDRQETAMSNALRFLKARATDLQTDRAFLRSLSHQIEHQAKVVEGIQEKEDSKRDEVVEKSKSKKMVENLDEKRRVAAEKEVDRKDQRLIDVLAQRIRLEL